MPTAVDNLIRNAVRSPQSIPRVLTEAGDILDALMTDVAAESTAGEAVGAADAAGAAASGIGALLLLGGLLNAIFLLIFLRWMELALAALLGRVPWVGGSLERAVHVIFTPEHALESACLASAHNLAAAAWDGIQHFVRWEIDRIFPQTNAGKSTVTQAEIYHLNQRIDDTNARVDALNTRLNNLAHQTVGVQALPSPDLMPLQQTVGQLSHAIDVLYHNQTNLYRDIQTVQANENVLQRDFQQLQRGLTGVRTVQIGWADVVEQLQTLESGLSHQVASLQADMRTSQQRLTNLSPLTILLQPGLRGIRNLRKLEDNPCQCPQPQFLRPRNVEALAIELAIANGV